MVQSSYKSSCSVQIDIAIGWIQYKSVPDSLHTAFKVGELYRSYTNVWFFELRYEEMVSLKACVHLILRASKYSGILFHWFQSLLLASAIYTLSTSHCTRQEKNEIIAKIFAVSAFL